MTGHLVLSSIHATDSVGALLRLMEMGIEGFLVTSSVIGVVAQRLVRRICDHCRVAYEPEPADIEFAHSLGQPTPQYLYRGRGCARCNVTGYYDRVGVYEVMTLDEEVKRLTIRGANREHLVQAAVNAGMVSMRLDAWQKAVAGITTVQEILRSVYLI
jgi:type IV pilus assembly protein PilB